MWDERYCAKQHFSISELYCRSMLTLRKTLFGASALFVHHMTPVPTRNRTFSTPTTMLINDNGNNDTTSFSSSCFPSCRCLRSPVLHLPDINLLEIGAWLPFLLEHSKAVQACAMCCHLHDLSTYLFYCLFCIFRAVDPIYFSQLLFRSL